MRSLLLDPLVESLVFPRRFIPRGARPIPSSAERIKLDIHNGDDGDDESNNAGQVEAFFLRAHGEGPRPLLIFTHGNGELIDDWARPFEGFARAGLHVLLPEYRGYGRSNGRPSEKAIREDLIRFYDLALEDPAVDASRVVMMGRSIGGGAVVQLLAHRPAQALVLMNTFMSLPKLLAPYGLPALLLRDRFESHRVLEKLTLPTLIFHGDRDRIVPYSHALALQKLTGGELRTYPGAGHNDCFGDFEAFIREVLVFLEREGLIEG